MAIRTRTQFKALYGTSGTLFPDNTTAEISEADVRAFGEDGADSNFNISDDAYTAAFPQVTAGGTDTYTATAAPVITAYATGQKFQIKFTNASSGVSTLNLNALGAKKIFVNPTTQATTGHIVANQISLLAYDTTLDAAAGGFLMLGAPATATVPDADDTTKGIVEVAAMSEIVAGTDVGGTGAPLAVLPSHLGITRTVTGADADVQTDHNGFIILNSATPFNFTLDQLLAKTKITFINYGAGAVTFINGSGVTLAGSAVLPGATGTTYPSALVVYDTLTTPRVISGTSKIDSASTSTAGATITLDLNNQVERIFIGSASFGTAKAVALSNAANGLVFSMFLNLTNVAAVLTFPSNFTMQTGDGRWADAAHTFTPEVTGVYEFSAAFNSVTTDWHMLVTPTPYA